MSCYLKAGNGPPEIRVEVNSVDGIVIQAPLTASKSELAAAVREAHSGAKMILDTRRKGTKLRAALFGRYAADLYAELHNWQLVADRMEPMTGRESLDPTEVRRWARRWERQWRYATDEDFDDADELAEEDTKPQT